MANSEHLEILSQGVRSWNLWRYQSGVIPDLSHSNLKGAQLADIDLRQAELFKADLSDADLSGADLSESSLEAVNLCNANLTFSNLSNAYLQHAKLSHADLTGANLKKADLSESDLDHAKFEKANLAEANLRDTDLYCANMASADLSYTDLGGTTLIDSNLTAADLSGAKIYNANLRGADLSKSTLSGTIFQSVYLGDARFNLATIELAIFARLDLRRTIGLDTTVHRFDSTLGVDTLSNSQGHIPVSFLRGCGLSSNIVDYIPSLFGSCLEYQSCFISYASRTGDEMRDELFVEKVYWELQSHNIRTWYAPHDLVGGDKLHNQIDRAIQVHDRLLLVLSPHSMNSEWVKHEISRARQRERKEKRRILYPISLVPFEELVEWEFFDADMQKDSAAEIREYYIPIFDNWQDDRHFGFTFNKLLKGLEAT